MQKFLKYRLLGASAVAGLLNVAVAVLALPLWVGVAVVLVSTMAAVWFTLHSLQPVEQLEGWLLSVPNLDVATPAKTPWATSKNGTGYVVNAVELLRTQTRELDQSHHELTQNYNSTLQQFATVCQQLANDASKVEKVTSFGIPWKDAEVAVGQAVDQVRRQLLNTQRRMFTYQAILNDLPPGVVVCDDAGQILYSNSNAADLLDIPANAKATNLFTLFSDAPDAATSDDPDAPKFMTNAQVKDWLTTTRQPTGYVAVDDGSGTLCVQLQRQLGSQRHLKNYHVLQVTDVSGDLQKQHQSRFQHRRNVAYRLCTLVNTETKSSIAAVRTQANLLSQAAKQAGQRERFIPKVQRLVEEISRQEVLITLLGWLGRLNMSEATAQEVAEFRVLDVVEEAVDQLQPIVNERNNTLRVTGDAGWMVADSEWLHALLVGMLFHANSCLEGTSFTVDLRRRSGATGANEQCEVIVHYPGPSIDEEMLADVLEPFGRLRSTALVPSGPSGFPLGLSVSARILRLMGGDLKFDYHSNEMFLTAILPTREMPTVAAAPIVPASEVTFEQTDMLGGFEVGGAKADASETISERTAAPKEQSITFNNDDTVGNWFGSSN